MDNEGSIELAEAYYLIAKHNMKSAKDNFEKENYPECVMLVQQAVEKVGKAIISQKDQFISGHMVSAWIATNFPNLLSPDELQKMIEIEGYANISHYPFRKRNTVINPLNLFTKSKTDIILKNGNCLFLKLEKYYLDKK